MRIGEVDVAAPDPAPAHLRLGTYEPRGLGIVDDEKVLYKFHAPPVLLVIGHEDVLDLMRQVVIAAMQRVVKTLGDFVEVIAAGDDLPLGRNFEFVHQRDKAVQDLGHATAHRGGVDHLDGLALEMTGEKADFVELRLTDDGGIIFQARRRRRRRRLGLDAGRFRRSTKWAGRSVWRKRRSLKGAPAARGGSWTAGASALPPPGLPRRNRWPGTSSCTGF